MSGLQVPERDGGACGRWRNGAPLWRVLLLSPGGVTGQMPVQYREARRWLGFATILAVTPLQRGRSGFADRARPRIAGYDVEPCFMVPCVKRRVDIKARLARPVVNHDQLETL